MSSNNEELSRTQSFLTHAFGLAVARSLLAPLDVMSVTSQVGLHNPMKTPYSTEVSRLCKTEGVRALWKGNGLACCRVLPYTAVHSFTLGVTRFLLSEGNDYLTASEEVQAEGVATSLAVIATYPLVVLKTRFIVQHTNKKIAVYKNIGQGLQTIWQTEGVRALYKGLLTRLLAKIPNVIALGLATRALNQSRERPYSNLLMSPSDVLLRATVHSCLALGLTYPFDTVLKKLQAQSKMLPNNGGVPTDQNCTNVRTCFSSVISSQGWPGLWRGFLPAFIRMSLFSAAVYLGLKGSRKICLAYNRYIHEPDPAEDMDDETYLAMVGQQIFGPGPPPPEPPSAWDKLADDKT